MGCFKLNILENFKPTLKVVYKKPSFEGNIAQRFMSVDPLAEQFPSWNPYNYTMNNPIMLVDPDGMAPRSVDGGMNGSLSDPPDPPIVKDLKKIGNYILNLFLTPKKSSSTNRNPNHVAGSGVNITGAPFEGDSGRSIAGHPEDNVDVDYSILSQLKGMAKSTGAKKNGDGMTNAVSKTKNTASTIKKSIKSFKKGMKAIKYTKKILVSADTTLIISYADGIITTINSPNQATVFGNTVNKSITIPKANVSSVKLNANIGIETQRKQMNKTINRVMDSLSNVNNP